MEEGAKKSREHPWCLLHLLPNVNLHLLTLAPLVRAHHLTRRDTGRGIAGTVTSTATGENQNRIRVPSELSRGTRLLPEIGLVLVSVAHVSLLV